MSTGLVMNWARPAIGNSVGAESGSPRSTSRAGSSNCSSQPRFRRTWSPATSRSRVPHDEAVFGGAGNQVMASVAAGGPGLVAVGFGESRGNEGAMVWTSPDGVTWSRVVHNEVVFGGSGSQGMRSVATGVAGLVAAGYDVSGGDADAAVSSSPDGITWSRVPHDEVVFGGTLNQDMYSVATGVAGLVAAGFDQSGGDQDAAVWTSPDGITWSRVPHDEVALGGAGNELMYNVTAGGPGLVAVGWVESGDQDAAVWTSPDGITWSRVPHDEVAFGGGRNQRMTSMTIEGASLVITGYDSSGGDQDAAVWIFPDGE